MLVTDNYDAFLIPERFHEKKNFNARLTAVLWYSFFKAEKLTAMNPQEQKAFQKSSLCNQKQSSVL